MSDEGKNRRRFNKRPGRPGKVRRAREGYRRYKTPQELERISESYYYDKIISSVEIKKAILARIDELGVDLELVLREAGVTMNAFKSKYLEQNDPVSTPRFRLSHLESIMEVLGINYKVNVFVRKKENVRYEHLIKND